MIKQQQGGERRIRLSRGAGRWGFMFGAALVVAGCVGPLAKRLADKEVYPIIADKQMEALGTSQDFSIEPTTSPLTLAVLARAESGGNLLSTQGLTLSMADSLALAVDNNREYQRRKETLYRAALALTEDRYQFSPVFTGLVTARATRAPGTVVGGPGVERFGEVFTDLAVTKLFATGARVTVGMSQDFLRFYTGSARESASGALTGSIVQPLLQGGGYRVTLENLRQAERNVIYALRDFSRYQKEFTIDRIDQYFRLLQQQDQIENQFQSYQRLETLRRRSEAFYEAGRMASYEVDQARQDEIQARNSWVTAQANYATALDQWKLQMGLPIRLSLQPDPAELERLQEAGLVQLAYTLNKAEEVAVAERLDLLTARDRVEDVVRRLEISENGLLPVLDARADISIPDDGTNQPLDFQWERRRYSGQLQLELPLDRKRERNDYRRAVIDYQQFLRDADLARDQVLVQVRQGWIDVQDALQSYQIQEISRNLAAERIESVRMFMEAGQGVTIRDQLEADRALLSAQNDLTRQLINYTIARLEFYNAVEQLEVDDLGMWTEPDSPGRVEPNIMNTQSAEGEGGNS